MRNFGQINSCWFRVPIISSNPYHHCLLIGGQIPSCIFVANKSTKPTHLLRNTLKIENIDLSRLVKESKKTKTKTKRQSNLSVENIDISQKSKKKKPKTKSQKDLSVGKAETRHVSSQKIRTSPIKMEEILEGYKALWLKSIEDKKGLVTTSTNNKPNFPIVNAAIANNQHRTVTFNRMRLLEDSVSDMDAYLSKQFDKSSENLFYLHLRLAEFCLNTWFPDVYVKDSSLLFLNKTFESWIRRAIARPPPVLAFFLSSIFII